MDFPRIKKSKVHLNVGIGVTEP